MTNRSLALVLILTLVLAGIAFGQAQTLPSKVSPLTSASPLPAPKVATPTNIILMIGDGMGNAQVTAARVIGLGRGGRLNMDRMPVGGAVTTYSANSVVTDSAAAATALSTGFKTNNGVLGMVPRGGKLVSAKTILEAARAHGLAGGLVTTTTITHATPAGFASHVPSRGAETDIAVQELDDKPEVLFGGGKQNFIPKSADKSKRKDERDLIAEARKSGYEFVETADQLKAAKSAKLLGLFQMDALTTELPEPPLADLASKAIETLSKNKKGFFLMVEGGQIDWRCHANDAEGCIKQTLGFDAAIARALDFAAKDGHTLVIVTADHETGGLTLNGDEAGGFNFTIGWSTKSHTGTQIPLYAYGPGASLFGGLHDNTELPRLMARLLGYKDFAAEPAR